MPELSRCRARVAFASLVCFASALSPLFSLARDFSVPVSESRPDPIKTQRLTLLREGPLDRDGTKWLSSGLRASFYDSELEMLLPRAGIALSGGYRPGT